MRRRAGSMGWKAAMSAAAFAAGIVAIATVATIAGGPARALAQDSTLHEEDLPPADPGMPEPAPAHDEWEHRETHSVTVEKHEETGGAAGAVEGSMDKAGRKTRGGMERAGEATGKALDKVITKTGEGVGYVIDKTGEGLKSAGEALSGEGR